MQGEIPREIKDIIRNVQQMDLPENGIADIRIKIQGGEVMDRPMFANGGSVSPFATSLRQDFGTQQPQLGAGMNISPDLSQLQSRQLQTGFGGQMGNMQQQMQTMQQNPLETYKGYLGQKYIGPKQEQELQKVEEFVDLVSRAEQQQFGGQQGMGQFSNMSQPGLTSQPAIADIAPPTGPLADRADMDRFNLSNVTYGPNYAAGGAANKKEFPDLSGDGKVTQKDILIGRGVIEKQEGGAVNPEQAIAQVEMAAEAEGEQLGLDYLAQQMGGIDMAEDAEGLINALRGNEMPISARRTELAEYVGKEDAMRTPESVLAMVQPTIMMTEEGAMNSGIGELMQQLTSDVEMATEGGAPTDMGQGVGALMMAGAPEQPVQQFAAGGPVVRMAEAGDPSLEQRFQQYLPFFQNIQGVDAEDREKDRALALARAGFQFAAGVGPKGENIAGRPFLSQLGTVGQTALGDLAAIRAGERKSDSALRSMAAKAAIDAQTAQDTAAQQMKLETAKMNRALIELQIKEQGLMDRLILAEKGKGERQETTGEQALEQIERKGEQSLTEIAARGDETRKTEVLKTDLDVRLKNVQNILDMKRDAAQNNKPVDKVLSDGMGNQQVLRIFPDGQTTVFGVGQEGKFGMDSPGKMRQGVLKNVTAYGSGTLSPEVTTDVESSIDILYKPTGPQKILSEGLPLNLAIAIDKREKAGQAMNIDKAIVQKAQSMVNDFAGTTIKEIDSILSQDQKLKTFIPEDLEVEASFGGLSGPARALRYVNDQLLDVSSGMFGLPGMGIYSDDAVRDVVRSDAHLNALADETLKLLYEELGNVRLKAIVEVIQQEVDKIRPDSLGSDTKAYRQATILYDKLKEAEQQALKIYKIDPSGTHDNKDYLIAQNMVENQLPVLLKSFENLINSLGPVVRGPEDKGPDPAVIGGRAAQSQRRFENLLQGRK